MKQVPVKISTSSEFPLTHNFIKKNRNAFCLVKEKFILKGHIIANSTTISEQKFNHKTDKFGGWGINSSE